MKMDGVTSALLKTANNSVGQTDAAATKEGSNSPGFFDMLSAALQDVNSAQQQASQSGTQLALGDESYLHNTMIAYEKANLSLQLVLEVRNRLVEAYQEIMRIQV